MNYPEQKWFTRGDLETRIAADLRALGMPDMLLPNQAAMNNGLELLPDYAAWYIMENALSVITTDKRSLYKNEQL